MNPIHKREKELSPSLQKLCFRVPLTIPCSLGLAQPYIQENRSTIYPTKFFEIWILVFLFYFG